MPFGTLGQLGGLFSGDKTAMRFRDDIDDVQRRLLAGGEAASAARASTQQARTAALQAGLRSGNPALAGRQAALAAAQAAPAANMQAAQMRQQAMTQGAQMAQARIERERAREGQLLGTLLGAGAAGAAQLIPGMQAAPAVAGAAGAARSALDGSPAAPQTNVARSPVLRPEDEEEQRRRGLLANILSSRGRR